MISETSIEQALEFLEYSERASHAYWKVELIRHLELLRDKGPEIWPALRKFVRFGRTGRLSNLYLDEQIRR